MFEMNAEMIFGGRLQHARNMTGLSQRQVAESFGITKVGYQNYEYGRRSPSLEMLPRLARFFRVSADYLLGLTDEPRPYAPSKACEEKKKDGAE